MLMLKSGGRLSRRVGMFSVVAFVAAGAGWGGGAPLALGAGPVGTTRVSVSTHETQGDAGGIGAPAISQRGRYVAFVDRGSRYVGGDTNNANDVFVRDRRRWITRRMSMSTSGVHGNGASNGCAISLDGRYVVFESGASNLVPGDTNGVGDVFLRDWGARDDQPGVGDQRRTSGQPGQYCSLGFRRRTLCGVVVVCVEPGPWGYER